MTNINIIENKISETKKYLSILQQYKKHTQQEIEDDVTLRGAVERFLYLAVQATIDLAEATISLKGLRKPTIYSEAFEILHEAEFIPDDLTRKLRNMVGFRNIIFHDYASIDFDILYDILQNRLPDIELFIDIITKRIIE